MSRVRIAQPQACAVEANVRPVSNRREDDPDVDPGCSAAGTRIGSTLRQQFGQLGRRLTGQTGSSYPLSANNQNSDTQYSALDEVIFHSAETMAQVVADFNAARWNDDASEQAIHWITAHPEYTGNRPVYIWDNDGHCYTPSSTNELEKDNLLPSVHLLRTYIQGKDRKQLEHYQSIVINENFQPQFEDKNHKKPMIMPTRADGHCFYRALLASLEQKSPKNISNQEIRALRLQLAQQLAHDALRINQVHLEITGIDVLPTISTSSIETNERIDLVTEKSLDLNKISEQKSRLREVKNFNQQHQPLAMVGLSNQTALGYLSSVEISQSKLVSCPEIQQIVRTALPIDQKVDTHKQIDSYRLPLNYINVSHRTESTKRFNYESQRHDSDLLHIYLQCI